MANKTFTDTDNYTDDIQSKLLFDPVNYTDAGLYTCRAYNHPQCYTEEVVELTVECKHL